MIDPPFEVKTYCTRKNLKIEDRLGFGQDGSVWKAADSAIKLFDREAAYTRERDCYRRLSEHGVSVLNGVSVPWLIDSTTCCSSSRWAL
ncbi:MAG: hypothetical protein CMJ64_10495 [Planctomycetaceae bacterium]|nr:hypothetical protein [Planctomycetaceae bacterium]